MAVSLPQPNAYPEFSRTYSSQSHPLPRAPRRANRTVSSNAGVQRKSVRRISLAGRILRSRLMDDVCAVVVGAAGIFFLLAVARMLMVH